MCPCKAHTWVCARAIVIICAYVRMELAHTHVPLQGACTRA